MSSPWAVGSTARGVKTGAWSLQAQPHECFDTEGFAKLAAKGYENE